MKQKRRIILAIICALVIVGLPLLWLVHGSAPSSKNIKQTKTASKGTSAEATRTPDATGFNKSQFSTDDPSSIWVVVNKQRPLSPKAYAPADLVILPGGQYMRSEAAAALNSMIAAAKNTGHTITAASAYRSYDTQVAVYGREVQANGQAVADTQSARPGYSEHQTGLAVDIAGGGCSIEDCFGETAEGKWVAAHAHEYGFIMRYPPGKQSVTGYRTEAWHFRYVGEALATELHRTGILTLEEFFDLGAAPDY